jgi:glycosyltransferase involved in cell wall biosynthesis
MTERTVVVMPAYNAAGTLEKTLGRLPDGCCDEVIVVDDASRDETVEIAARLPVTLIRHPENRGYGGNQKTCYREALARGADFVVMVHPDDQYDARLVPAAVDILRLDVLDLVLGNRIRTRREALSGGMPRVKYLANRALTLIENMLTGQNLGEWHSGFRAYRRELLEAVPFERNSDDFVFDSQLLLQAVHFGFRVGDIPMPVRYFEEASSISFGRASTYALSTLGTLAAWYGHRLQLRRSPLFARSPPAAAAPTAPVVGGGRET